MAEPVFTGEKGGGDTCAEGGFRGKKSLMAKQSARNTQ